MSRPEPEPPPEPPSPIPATHHTALLTDLTPVCVYQPTLPIDVGGLPYCHSRRHPLSTTAHNARLGVGQRPVAGSAAADMGHAAAGDTLGPPPYHYSPTDLTPVCRPSSRVLPAHPEKHAAARQQRPTTSQEPPPVTQGATRAFEGPCGRYVGSCHRRGVDSGPFGRTNDADSRVAPLTGA